MNKSSNKGAEAYRESRQVESDSGDFCEWTCEGGAEGTVGIDGGFDRYPKGVCRYVYHQVACSSSVPYGAEDLFFMKEADLYVFFRFSMAGLDSFL